MRKILLLAFIPLLFSCDTEYPPSPENEHTCIKEVTFFISSDKEYRAKYTTGEIDNYNGNPKLTSWEVKEAGEWNFTGTISEEFVGGYYRPKLIIQKRKDNTVLTVKAWNDEYLVLDTTFILHNTFIYNGNMINLTICD